MLYCIALYWHPTVPNANSRPGTVLFVLNGARPSAVTVLPTAGIELHVKQPLADSYPPGTIIFY